MTTLIQLKEKHKKEIEQLKTNEKYFKNFLKIGIDCNIDMVYDAESVFKYQSISINVDTFKDAMKLYQKFKKHSIALHKIKGWGSFYPETELKENKESEFKLKHNYIYKVSKINGYNHTEKLCFYIKYAGKVYNLQINIKWNNVYYSFSYSGKTEKSSIMQSFLHTNKLPFKNQVKLWASDNINDFILYD